LFFSLVLTPIDCTGVGRGSALSKDGAGRRLALEITDKRFKDLEAKNGGSDPP